MRAVWVNPAESLRAEQGGQKKDFEPLFCGY